MSRTYRVEMPRAEGRYLAGIGAGWPATPEARCVHAVREWVNGLKGRRSPQVPVQKIINDLEAILDLVPMAERPVCGPFAARGRTPPLPGRVEYLGSGAVRLDDVAVSSLTGLRDGEDFRVIATDLGPVLVVGSDRYSAYEEGPEVLPPLPRRVRQSQKARPARVMRDPNVLRRTRDGLLKLDIRDSQLLE